MPGFTRIHSHMAMLYDFGKAVASNSYALWTAEITPIGTRKQPGLGRDISPKRLSRLRAMN